MAEDEGNLGRSCAGLGRFEVVLADRIRLQTSVGVTSNASRKRGREGAPSEGRRPGSSKSSSLTRRRSKVSLVFFSQRGLLRGEEGATEDVRSFFATLPTA